MLKPWNKVMTPALMKPMTRAAVASLDWMTVVMATPIPMPTTGLFWVLRKNAFKPLPAIFFKPLDMSFMPTKRTEMPTNKYMMAVGKSLIMGKLYGEDAIIYKQILRADKKKKASA